MRVFQYIINVTSRTKINLIPIGDGHIGSLNSNENKLKKLVAWIRKTPNTYVILMGDMIEAINVSDKRFDVDSLVDYTGKEKKKELNNLLYRQVQRVVDILLPIRTKIIGALEGNHEATAKLRYYTDPTVIMCEKLGIEYLTYSAIVRLIIRRASKNKKKVDSRMVDIYCHHGFGGGQTIGGKLNKVHKLATNFNADIYLMGHVHDKYVFTTEQLGIMGKKPDQLRLVARKKVFALTGSFFETYIDGYSSYAEKMAYSPIPTGVVKLIIEPFKHTHIQQNDINTAVDIHPSV